MHATTIQRIDYAQVIADLVSGHDTDYEYVGVRVHDDQYAIGQTMPDSRRWDDGEPTDDMLDGTSAIDLRDNRAAQLIQAYMGDYLSIIAGWYASDGEDDGEIVIRDAVVLATIKI